MVRLGDGLVAGARSGVRCGACMGLIGVGMGDWALGGVGVRSVCARQAWNVGARQAWNVCNARSHGARHA